MASFNAEHIDNQEFLDYAVQVITGALEKAEDIINDPKILENGKVDNGIESPTVVVDGNTLCITKEIVDGLLISNLRAHFKV